MPHDLGKNVVAFVHRANPGDGGASLHCKNNRKHLAGPSAGPITENGEIIGTYYLRANNAGGGAHVANCGYMVAGDATGRGFARAMCAHPPARAKERGFRAMQFIVIATNE
jgi:RimJ/RimL family protein N-acetyltransferase